MNHERGRAHEPEEYLREPGLGGGAKETTSPPTKNQRHVQISIILESVLTSRFVGRGLPDVGIVRPSEFSGRYFGHRCRRWPGPLRHSLSSSSHLNSSLRRPRCTVGGEGRLSPAARATAQLVPAAQLASQRCPLCSLQPLPSDASASVKVYQRICT